MKKKPSKYILKTMFFRIPALFVIFSLAWVIAYKYVPVQWTPLMLKRSVRNLGNDAYKTRHTWVDLDEISPVMVRAVLAAEDGRFMEHHGIDVKELVKMHKEHSQKGKKIRGCSTISQQVAKNCFTFCGRSWWRKAFETYYTLLVELIWSKERIMEVYLNIAETGKGVFGVEEAAMINYNRHASNLTTEQAVCIACVLPNPLVRSPKAVPQKNQNKYNVTYQRTLITPYPFGQRK